MFQNKINNNINQLINKFGMELLHTKSIHSPYTISGIFGKALKAKSPNTVCIKAFLAGPTRLELATSCVTGRRSNQLNYDPEYKELL